MLNGKRNLIALLGVVALAAASFNVRAQSAAPLVQPANLEYLGSFKLPSVSGNGFDYGGTALGYNPANDSLYVVGHVYDQDTAEVRIPTLGGTASVLQSLTDSLAGKLGAVGGGDTRIGGNLVYRNRLYVTAFIFYDATGGQILSHYSRPLTLSSGIVTGPLRAGPMGAGFYSGYMGLIPAEWQSRLGGPALTGNCCLSIISRTSYGPAAFAFNPENVLGTAQPLVYYTRDHQTLGSYGASGVHPVFNGSTRITGIVFPEGTSSVLFFGMTGVGNYCYGEAAACGDPSNSYKGEHAYPYRGYVWAYDANELAAVKSGAKEPWAVTPYATWELPQLGNVSDNFGVAGAAYDPATGRVFVSKKNADAERPVIYVYRVNNSALQKVPQPPEDVIVIP